MDAMNWINATIGSAKLPYTANNTILSWWDYGDWINYFGHAGSVLRGDNQLPQLNYETAYMFVDANQTQLADFMKSVGANYLMFETGLLPKWSALNYLSCVYQNQTNFNTSIGTSACEINNTPTYLLFPAQINTINNYCSFSNSTNLYIKAISNRGDQYCLQTIIPSGQTGREIDGHIYDTNGTLMNLNLVPVGQQTIQNNTYNVYLLLYIPNRTTCTYPASENVPQFYKSNYYLLYDEGCIQNNLFTQVYPANGSVGAVRIWKLNG
jgi:hypothetical protein